jgi:hypothetical protein
MNLAEIRKAMFAQADWSPNQSTEAIARVDGFINRAYNQLSLEAPYLFFEDNLRTSTEPDVASATDSDTVMLLGNNDITTDAPDPWTFRTTYTKTVADAAVNVGLYTTTWKTDRSWDGRQLEITLTDGTVIRNQIRTIWLHGDYWKFTVVHPWNWSEHGTGTEAAGFKFRIFTEVYAFPDDIIKMRSMRLFNNTQQYPLNVMGQDEAEQRTLVGPRPQIAAGIPRVAFRREHFQLEGPGLAPRLSNNSVTSGDPPVLTAPWKGPEPPGTFEYMVTYTWGKRDAEFRLPGLPKWDTYAGVWTNDGTTISRAPTHTQFADNRIREPRYESAPSPVSEQHTVSLVDQANTLGYMAITVTVPNIEYVLGFISTQVAATSSGDLGTRVSEHQSGIHVRIYRRRVSTLEMAPGTPYEDLDYAVTGLTGQRAFVDNKEKFYLLAEMRVDELNKGRFIDDGQYIPDRLRPLRDTHGYQQFALYPVPDKRYEVDIRCVRRPQELEDERDVPQIHAEATNALINRAMTYLYESMGNMDASAYAQARYEQEMMTLNKRYGDMRPAAVPVLRRMVRARYSYRSRDSYRKWYKTDS